MFTVYLASENAILLFVMGWVVVASVLREMLGVTPGCDSTEDVELQYFAPKTYICQPTTFIMKVVLPW